MKPRSVLVTGGAGFVGSSVALDLKRRDPDCRVVALDNLKRRGSELNLPRLRQAGIEFVHGDIRSPDDLRALEAAELLVECSAEPSVLAGLESSPSYVLQTNLVGTLHLLEYCRAHGTAMLFLSTSRVYPIEALAGLRHSETATRFELLDDQALPGVSAAGVAEGFPLDGPRSIYGATKLASELFIQEYAYAYGLKAVVNRCGVLAGPWQMGKVDQGVVVLWAARHHFGGRLSYIGYGGSGKQVRDVLHVDDLGDLLALQVAGFEKLAGGLFTVGGGAGNAVSLLELTDLCRRHSGREIPIDAVTEPRPADIPIFVTDSSRVTAATGWMPRRSVETVVADVFDWLRAHDAALGGVLAG